MKNLLLSITTTKGSDWRGKINEVARLGIEEVALFPTCLDKRERSELYSKLTETKVKSVPFVHLRSDMDLTEIEHLIAKYGTKVFNTHTKKEHPFVYDYSRFKDIICLENTSRFFDEDELLKDFGGVCLDFAHLENSRIQAKEVFVQNEKILKRNKIKCNHLSAILKEPHLDYEDNKRHYDCHMAKDFSNFEYLNKYPKEFFSPFIALELENSIEEQIKIRDFLQKFLAEKLV